MKRMTALLLCLNLLDVSAYAANIRTITLPNLGLPILGHAKQLKSVAKNTEIQFSVWLQLRNKTAFDQRVREIYDTNSKNYRKFVSAEEFRKFYAPSPTAENKVLQYFIAQGMYAKIINHRISVTASAQQIETTFNVKMNYYQYKDRIAYANNTVLSLPVEFKDIISGISGLNNLAHYEPAIRKRFASQTSSRSFPINMRWKSFIPMAQPTTTSFAGFTGAQLQQTFNLSRIPAINGTTIDGSGQTLVIIDACGNRTADEMMTYANDYNNANNLTLFSASNFTVINPDGTPYTTCAHPTSAWDDEIALDVQSSHTLAPGMNTVLVLAQSDHAPLDDAVYDVISTLTTNNYTIAGFNNAYVVSNSWGLDESSGSSPAMETHLETAAGAGISFNYSTGDCGDGTYSSSWPCSIIGATPTVEYPASSAYTTAVGATSMFVDNNWNYAFEALWGSYYDGAFYGGTTGGISQFYGPVTWQNSISNFYAGGYTNGPVSSYGKRALPDIAMLGDPYTGLTIYEGGTSFVYGGTSLACPLFSATLILVNQARMLRNNGIADPIGQAAPYVYMYNSNLRHGKALNLISPPHVIISGAQRPPNGAPLSAFKIRNDAYNYDLTFGWDSSMTLEPEDQFWNDGVGVGSPYLPNFITIMSQF